MKHSIYKHTCWPGWQTCALWSGQKHAKALLAYKVSQNALSVAHIHSLSSIGTLLNPGTCVCAWTQSLKHACVCLTWRVFIRVGVCVAEYSGMHCNKQMWSLYEVFTTGSAVPQRFVCVCVCGWLSIHRPNMETSNQWTIKETASGIEQERCGILPKCWENFNCFNNAAFIMLQVAVVKNKLFLSSYTTSVEPIPFIFSHGKLRLAQVLQQH